MSQVNATKWKGKVGLIDATEYVRASTNDNCTGVGAYWYNSSCYNNSNTHNWMYLNDFWWTISPFSSGGSYIMWRLTTTGPFNITAGDYITTNARGVRPVVTLSPEVKIISGDGSSSSPYQLTI